MAQPEPAPSRTGQEMVDPVRGARAAAAFSRRRAIGQSESLDPEVGNMYPNLRVGAAVELGRNDPPAALLMGMPSDPLVPARKANPQ